MTIPVRKDHAKRLKDREKKRGKCDYCDRFGVIQLKDRKSPTGTVVRLCGKCRAKDEYDDLSRWQIVATWNGMQWRQVSDG